MNLLHNAIVHNVAAGGVVWMTASADNDGVWLDVANTGEELDPRMIPLLPERFQRGSDRTRTDHAGVGLGLAIVKSITDAHGGTFSIAPRAGGGIRAPCGCPLCSSGSVSCVSLMSRIRHLVYGRGDASNAADAFRNVGQLRLTGSLAEPLPFHSAPPETVILDPAELPDELRED